MSSRSALLRKSTIAVLFVASYLLSIYSVNNKLGTHIAQGYTSTGEYIPHDYYTGFPTQTPFKIAALILAFGLFIILARTIFGPKLMVLKTLVLLVVLLVLGLFISFSLSFEF